MSNQKINNILFNPQLYSTDLLELQDLSSKIKKNRTNLIFSKEIVIDTSSDYTLTFLEEMLHLFLFNRKIKSEINSTSFGSLNFLIRDLDNKFWKSKSDITLLIPSSRKLNFLPDATDSNELIIKKAKKEADIWIQVWKNTNKNIIQTTFDPLPYSNLGNLDSSKPGGYSHYIKIVNSILQENSPTNVNLIDLDILQNRNKNFNLYDNKMFYLSKQPFSMDAVPYISNLISSLVAGIIGMAKKVLITDLDNTLWGGVIGDDGVNNIKIGDSSSEGESYSNFQKYLKSLTQKGIVLCVCSKNDFKIANDAFIKNSNMELNKNDITMFVANFRDKASNIKYISKTLNLGLDSFIFIDDSSIECELVKQKLPEVMVVNLSNQDPSDFIDIVENTYPFYFKKITKEDLDRSKSYKQIASLNVKSKSSSDLDQFLKGLQPKILIKEVDNNTIERSAQLIAKTNQFKLNSRLFSPKQLISKKINSLSITFKDKFHNYGIISSLVYKISRTDKSIYIENWVMSCRVFSRRIEDFIIDYLITIAKKNNFSKISFDFELTKKNIYLQKFFTEIGLKINKNKKYLINLKEFKINKRNYIKMIK